MSSEPTNDDRAAAAWRARVGARVVVRHRLPGGGATDVIGVLEAVDGDRLRVAGRSGPVEVVLDDVVAGKVVPPRPARAAPPHRAVSILGLESVMALHWQALEVEHLGGWLLRASGGFTGRGNSVLPLGAAGLPPAQAIAAVRRWYGERGLPPLASVPGPAPGGPAAQDPCADLRTALLDDGWYVRANASAVVLTAATGDLRAPVPLPAGTDLDLATTPGAAWLAAYRYRGQELAAQALPLLLSAPEQVFASVREGERTVAVARGSLGGAWGGLTAVEVTPSHRRRGLARALLSRVASWAWSRGAASMYVQVAEGNDAADALYERAGFAVHHRYDYLEATSAGGAG